MTASSLGVDNSANFQGLSRQTTSPDRVQSFFTQMRSNSTWKQSSSRQTTVSKILTNQLMLLKTACNTQHINSKQKLFLTFTRSTLLYRIPFNDQFTTKAEMLSTSTTFPSTSYKHFIIFYSISCLSALQKKGKLKPSTKHVCRLYYKLSLDCIQMQQSEKNSTRIYYQFFLFQCLYFSSLQLDSLGMLLLLENK